MTSRPRSNVQLRHVVYAIYPSRAGIWEIAIAWLESIVRACRWYAATGVLSCRAASIRTLSRADSVRPSLRARSERLRTHYVSVNRAGWSEQSDWCRLSGDWAERSKLTVMNALLRVSSAQTSSHELYVFWSERAVGKYRRMTEV